MVHKKVEWKCSMQGSGEQYVMTTGIAMMQMLSAESWGMPEQSRLKALELLSLDMDQAGLVYCAWCNS